jgi:hypothetical protein
MLIDVSVEFLHATMVTESWHRMKSMRPKTEGAEKRKSLKLTKWIHPSLESAVRNPASNQRFVCKCHRSLLLLFCGKLTFWCVNLASAFGIRNLLPSLRLLLLTQSYPITEIMLQLILLLPRQADHLTCVRKPLSYCRNYSRSLSQQNEGDSVSIRSGKLVPTETSRAASVVNEEEASWTDVNLDEQRDDQQRPGNLTFAFVLEE